MKDLKTSISNKNDKIKVVDLIRNALAFIKAKEKGLVDEKWKIIEKND